MIERWRAVFPNDDGYMTEDKWGKWVYYADHEAIVKELVEALENCLGFVVAHPQFTDDLRNLIAKARGES